MDIGLFGYYLIIINIVAFILLGLYLRTGKGQGNILSVVISLLGGSLGVLISILLVDRKSNKENMMSRVFIVCTFVIQIIIFLIINGHHTNNINFDFWTFFSKHTILIVYLAIINLINFATFGIDKFNAIKQKSRIKIVTLLGLAFIGGSLGGLLGMYLFKHKTQKSYFKVGIPLIIVMQFVVIFYIMNMSW